MKKLLIIIFLSLVCFSCGDFFNKEIELDEIDLESKIVLNSLFDPADTVMNILVSYSTIINSYDYSDVAISNAKVTLSVNKSLAEGIVFSEDNYFYITNLQAYGGDLVEIMVEADGYSTVRSSTVIPQKPDLSNAFFDGVRYRNKKWKAPGVVEQEAIKFTLKDTPDERNYYEVFVDYYDYSDDEALDKELDRHTISIYSPSSFMEETGRRYIFSDAAFSDGSIELEVWVARKDNYMLTVRSVTKAYYDYIATAYQQMASEYPDVFSDEPGFVYSNIEGGYGIFAAYSASEIKVVEN